jgi:hypothetical protein
MCHSKTSFWVFSSQNSTVVVCTDTLTRLLGSDGDSKPVLGLALYRKTLIDMLDSLKSHYVTF